MRRLPRQNLGRRRKGTEIHRCSVLECVRSSPSPLCVPKTLELYMPGLLLFLPAFVGGLVVAPVGPRPSGVVGVAITTAHGLVPVLLVRVSASVGYLFSYGYLCVGCILILGPAY